MSRENGVGSQESGAVEVNGAAHNYCESIRVDPCNP